MRPLNGEYHNDVREYDYVLVACGSDYRAYQTLRKSKDFGITFKNVLIFDFEERHDYADAEMRKAYQSYEELALNIKPVTCSIKDPSTCVKALHDSEPNLHDAAAVALDISCFTKPYSFCILKYLKEQAKINHITALYTEPMSYVFAEGLFHSYHSTSGPLSIMEIPGFPGNDIRTTRKTLVVLLGFDGELSSFITDEVAPNDTTVINGFPAYAPKFKDISLINNEKLLSSIPRESILYSRANNPFETFNLLEHIFQRDSSAFINVAPIGTKPMALGACLFALVHPSVRIVYPLPTEYANITTQKCWYSWSYEIPLRIN